ncbi:MAG: DUF6288 domain-containing protein [Planctomycetota bacterium]|jgi:hypothetical protein
MDLARSSALLPALLFSLLMPASDARAARDPSNQERWAKPVENGPDKDVPGFLVNLGPTGARAILKTNSFVVKYVFPNSPAAGKLQPGDEIVAANGKQFSDHTFGGKSVGYDGPMMDFGNAIEDSEGGDGGLLLKVKRDGLSTEVEIRLEPIGRFSPTFPLGCRKSELLKQRAYKYLVDNPGSWGGMSHSRSAVALALLTSGNAQHESKGKGIVQKWNDVPGPGTWTWNLAYQAITLAEYHLQTGDKSVLPTIRGISELLRTAQYKGKIVVWAPHGGADQKTIDEHQALYEGGFGHAPYRQGVGLNGYGPMQFPTILAVIAWQLAEECGVVIDDQEEAIKAAFRFIDRGTADDGHVAYGGEFTLNHGPVDPVKWKKGRSTSYVGRVGAALIAHKMSPEIETSEASAELSASYLKVAHRSLPDGHACSVLGFSWGLLGAAASHDPAVIRTVYDYHKAWFNMARCHDGSFVVLPGRDYADGSYYRSSRYHLTGVMALFLGLSNPKLRIQGVRVSIPGVNHKALRGAYADAYEKIVGRNFGAAAKALASPGATDRALVAKMMKIIDEEARKAVDHFGKLDRGGKWHTLKEEIKLYRRMFGGVPLFDREAERWEKAFGEKPGGLIVVADKYFDEAMYAKASAAIEAVLASSDAGAFAEQARRRKERIDQAVKDAMSRLEEMQKTGEWQGLKEEVELKKKQFGGIEAFDERAAGWRSLLATPTGRAMAEAHKHHLKQAYGPSAKALAKIAPDSEHAAAAKALMDRNRAAVELRLRELEALETGGRWHTLKEAVRKAKLKMSGMDVFDRKAAALDAVFKTRFGNAMVMADRLRGTRSYKRSLRALESATASADQPGQAELAGKVVQDINAEVQKSLDILVLMEEEGDWYLLKKSLMGMKQKFSGIPIFDEKAKSWGDAFKTRPVADAVRAGQQFQRLAYMVNNKPSNANLRYLQAFAREQGDSFYGREAKKLLEKYGK